MKSSLFIWLFTFCSFHFGLKLRSAPIVPSVNLSHYRAEDPMQGALRDISCFKEQGLTQFQIDSEYDKWFFNDPNRISSVLPEEFMDINIMTFNIRYPNPDDGFNYWPNRKELVASMIRYHDADILGIQEAFRSQLDELVVMLPDYAWVGVCRTSGDQNPNPDNEFSAILYKLERFDVLQNQTFWLSESPDIVGEAGWDAALPRIVTWAQFRDRRTDKTFFHFNTHFDHRGKEARAKSAQLLLNKITDIAGPSPVLISGDFNAVPESTPYQYLTAPQESERIYDALTLTESPHHGPLSTLTSGFKIAGVPGRRIDYIFIKNGVRILRHAILSDSWGGRLPSDHLPVLATCRIP
ncbi:MAG: endonuclease/exonuclease/phosphatase family protein [Bacteroidota bacterium]